MNQTITYKFSGLNKISTLRDCTSKEIFTANLAVIMKEINVPENCYARIYYSRELNNSEIFFCGVEVCNKIGDHFYNRQLLGCYGDSEENALENALQFLKDKLLTMCKQVQEANELCAFYYGADVK